MIDTENFAALYENHRKALAQANQVNKAALFDALSTAGVTSVTVSFDGEGDSGQIEDIRADANGKPYVLPEKQIDIRRVGWGTDKSDTQQTTLRDAIEQLCYDYLSQEHEGWEINDGAFGEFTFQVAERTIELEFNGRYSDSVLFSHTF